MSIEAQYIIIFIILAVIIVWIILKLIKKEDKSSGNCSHCGMADDCKARHLKSQAKNKIKKC